MQDNTAESEPGAHCLQSLCLHLLQSKTEVVIELMRRHLTNRWSGRVDDKVPSPGVGVRAAQLNR